MYYYRFVQITSMYLLQRSPSPACAGLPIGLLDVPDSLGREPVRRTSPCSLRAKDEDRKQWCWIALPGPSCCPRFHLSTSSFPPSRRGVATKYLLPRDGLSDRTTVFGVAPDDKSLLCELGALISAPETGRGASKTFAARSLKPLPL